MFLQMKMFFSMHKQKIFIILLSIITVILIVVAAHVLSFYKSGTYKTTTFVSSKKDFSITLQDNLNMDISGNSEYELLLKSADNNNVIAVARTEKNPIYSTKELIDADKTNYTSQYENPQNISEINLGKLKDYSYYKYSFETEEYFVEVYWLEANNYYYVFDFAADKNSSIDLKSNIITILETLEFKSFSVTEI